MACLANHGVPLIQRPRNFSLSLHALKLFQDSCTKYCGLYGLTCTSPDPGITPDQSPHVIRLDCPSL